MLYVPGFFGENLMDSLMNDFDRSFSGKKNPLYGKHAKDVMKTDVKENADSYELDVDLPGFKKDEIQLELNKGALTISAEKGLDKSETDKEGRLIRQERYAGAVSRSFYVGEDVTEDEIKAKFENGVLHLYVPRKDAQKALPQKKQILIEG